MPEIRTPSQRLAQENRAREGSLRRQEHKLLIAPVRQIGPAEGVRSYPGASPLTVSPSSTQCRIRTA
ncbi:hypothetical protein NDU88_003187 [Pleurodeles waltl]|uniref:Uncharacterized protein n=1 Tax=Pleurodeles waltl TaxID=8319 RepID=A0AAV7T5H0_PLEWA|nr:hypothetical protein NDU88_003187 [Pleurodeles waltl]